MFTDFFLRETGSLGGVLRPPMCALVFLDESANGHRLQKVSETTAETEMTLGGMSRVSRRAQTLRSTALGVGRNDEFVPALPCT